MIRILCINDKWLLIAIIYANMKGFRLPQIGDEYDSEGIHKCACGCGTVGYWIKSLDDHIIFPCDYFVEIHPDETTETEKTKEPAVVFEGFFDWSFPYYEGGI